VSNFDDIYQELDRTGAAALVTDAGKLTMQIGAWIEDGAARQEIAVRARRCVDKLGGALDLAISALEPYFMQLRIQNQTAHA
jgi:3-deoxy-D-manno-octulosonic-acid transferase